MDYPNILTNPTLQTEGLNVEEVTVPGYPPQYIWQPTNWQVTVTPTIKGEYTKRTSDLAIIPTVWPQSIGGKRVLTIETNTKHFVVKLEQNTISLKANQRYLVKVSLTPAVQIVGTAQPADLAWRITVNHRDTEWTNGFQNAASVTDWGSPQSALMVLHSYETQTIGLAVEIWSKFGNLDKQIYIHSVEVLEVEATYGDGGIVHVLGTPVIQPPGPSPDPPDLPPDDTTLPTAPGWLFALMLFVCACVLGVIGYSMIAPHIQYVAMEAPVEELLNQLFAIPAITPIAYTSGIVYFLVEIIKRLKARIDPENNQKWLTPEASAVVLIGFFMLMYAIAEQFQVEGALKDFATLVTQLIAVLGPYVLGMIGTQVVTSVSYNAARNRSVVGFNFKDKSA